MMKDKKTIKKVSQLNFYSVNNTYNYMINAERQKNDKEKITIKFLLPNNNYNYMINDERQKNVTKKKSAIKFLLSNNNYNYYDYMMKKVETRIRR